MARDMTAAMLSALAERVKWPILFYEGEFASSTVRFHSGTGPFQWDSKTWIGSGDLGRISQVIETGELRATGLTVGLNGLDPTILATVLNQAQRSKKGKLWLGLLDSAGALINDPKVLFNGFLDQPKLGAKAGKSDIGIVYQNRLAALQRQKVSRFTDEDQQARFLGDRGFEYQPQTQEWNEKWGSR